MNSNLIEFIIIVSNRFIGFTIRLLGNHIKLAQLETQTMMILDPFPPLSATQLRSDTDTTKTTKKCQYEPIFMQLADENRCDNIIFTVANKI